MFTWSENPNADLWKHIRFLGKESNCKRLLNGEIASKRDTIYQDTGAVNLGKKARQISMCINQAIDYFTAAEQVTINTSPLIYFYGMLALAKALIVANKKELYLENINYHGLNTRPINDQLGTYRGNPDSWKMESEYAITNNGVFKEFASIIDGFNFNNNIIITFKELLSVCPEISEMYEKYYQEPSKVLYLYSERIISKDTFSIEICPAEINENKIYYKIPELKNDFSMDSAILHNQARKFTSKGLNEFPEYMGIFHPFVGGKYLVGGIEFDESGSKRKRYFNPAVIDYIGMFILSDCVRYKQDLWQSVIEGKQSGILGIIELYISVVKRRFPNIILDNIWGEPFRYGGPARFM